MLWACHHRDLSMILCDPFAINTLSLSTVRHLQESKTFPAPFLCMILVEAETHTGEKGRRETVVGEGKKTGRVPPPRAGSELSRCGERKKF